MDMPVASSAANCSGRNRGRTALRRLAKLAEGELFEVRHLGIGMAAPDIAGEDADSQKFKLSDYRGKVVLLDFWGNW